MDKTTERIKDDAIAATDKRYPEDAENLEYQEYEVGYIAGATAEASNAQKLLEALQQIVNAPAPANEREYMSWFVTAKNVAGGAISAYEAENEVRQLNGKGKEVVKEEPIAPLPDLGICAECKTRPATTDYNEHGHFVCQLCDDSLTPEFDNEYR